MLSIPTEIKIRKQGAPIVGDAWIREKEKRVVALDISMRSKSCEVVAGYCQPNGIIGVTIQANKDSLYLCQNMSKKAWTEIDFCDFKGWHVWCCAIARYTLAACLIRDFFVRDEER